MFDHIYNSTPQKLEIVTRQSIEWIMKHKYIHSKLNETFAGFEELEFIIPSVIDEDHDFIPPWYYLLHEADQELDSAMILLLAGMYKDTLRTLRSFIELNLFALYCFTKNDKKDFRRWLLGEQETPKKSILIYTILKNNPRIALLDKKLRWNKRLCETYKKLSKFVHTQGISNSFISLRNSNTIIFSEMGIKYGIKYLLDVIQIISEGFVANFPIALQPLPLFQKFGFSGPAGGFLDVWQVEQVSKIFPKRHLIKLQSISDHDEEVTSIVESIRSRPDLSKREILESLERALKCFPKEKDKVYKMMKNGKITQAFAMVGAIQKAFLRATTPLLNEYSLGIRRTKNGNINRK